MESPVMEPQVDVSHGAQLAAALDGPPTPEEVKPEVPAEVAPPVAPVVPEDKSETPKEEPKVDEVQELRGIVRSLMRQNADMKSFMQKQQRTQTTPQVAPIPRDPLDDVFGVPKEQPTPPPKVEPQAPSTRYEELQQGLGYIGATKGPLLDTLVATMEMNPKFEDVREVCSRDNLDSLVEQAAKRYIESNPGTDFVEATMEIEMAIWSQQNPYKYMYDAIKATNPKYVAKGPEVSPASAAAPLSPAQQRAKEGPKPVEAPTSIVPLGGSDADRQGGWTTEKIGSLDDEAYMKLPEEVRLKYLAGDFDVK